MKGSRSTVAADPNDPELAAAVGRTKWRAIMHHAFRIGGFSGLLYRLLSMLLSRRVQGFRLKVLGRAVEGSRFEGWGFGFCVSLYGHS